MEVVVSVVVVVGGVVKPSRDEKQCGAVRDVVGEEKKNTVIKKS